MIFIDKTGKKIKLNLEPESIKKIVEESQGKHFRKSKSKEVTVIGKNLGIRYILKLNFFQEAGQCL